MKPLVVGEKWTRRVALSRRGLPNLASYTGFISILAWTSDREPVPMD